MLRKPSRAVAGLREYSPILLGLATYLFAPLFAWVYLGVLFAARGQSKLATFWTFVGFLPFALIINNSKKLEGSGLHDWQWYSDHFFRYPTLSFDQIWGDSLFPKNDPLEPLYFSASWLVANIWPGNLSALVALIVVVVYGTITLSVPLYRKAFELDSMETLGLQYALYGFGITFTLVTHLVRQEIAIGFLVLAMGLLMNRHWAPGITAMLLAISSHNAAGFISLMLITAVLLSAMSLRKLIPAAALVGSFLSIVYWWAHGFNYAGANDGGVSALVIIIDVLVVVGLILTSFQMLGSRRAIPVKALLGTLIMCSAFVITILFEPLPALRFYFFMTPFVGVGLFVITRKLLERGTDWFRIMLVTGFGLSVPLLGQLRILRSGFEFGTDFIDLIIMNILF